MQCGCARACQHGLPCVEMMMRFGRVRNESRPSGSRPELQDRLVVGSVVGFRRWSGALLRERRSYDIWGK
ncbi:unnamed protein product [Prunus armeniaca]